MRSFFYSCFAWALSAAALCLLAAGPLFAGSYVENFDIADNWHGSPMNQYSYKTYSNLAAALLDDSFSSDWAARSSHADSGQYAWKLATGEHWFRYISTAALTRFSLAIARDSGETPDIVIRYSRNSGVTWQSLYSGSDLVGNQPDQVYTQYVSPSSVIEPYPGKSVYLEVYKFLGAPLFIDSFSLDFVNPASNTVFLVAPAASLTTSVGSVTAFDTRSIADGSAQTGYGLSPAATEWTWLDTGSTGIVFGSAATNQFWLTSGNWYFAARWIRHDTSETNYGWDAVGQTGQSDLHAVYQLHVTNFSWSTVWLFNQPNSTLPDQQPGSIPGGISFSSGLSSNIPGNGLLSVDGFPSQRDQSKAITFFTQRHGRPNRGFFCRLRRDEAGPRFVDLQFSSDASSWQNWITNLSLSSTGVWYMAGGVQDHFTDYSNWFVRVIAYGSNGGALEAGEAQFAALVPEPAFSVFLLLSVFLKRFLNSIVSCKPRELS